MAPDHNCLSVNKWKKLFFDLCFDREQTSQGRYTSGHLQSRRRCLYVSLLHGDVSRLPPDPLGLVTVRCWASVPAREHGNCR